MTFVATVNVIIHVGATPVLVDCDRETMNVTPEAAAAAVTPRTRAIIPVHMAGRPCDMEGFADLSRRYGIAVVDDAAHAVEARWQSCRIGSSATATAFSFYVTKNLVTGEGGMLTTDREDLASDARIRSLHGLSRDAWTRYSSSGFQPYDALVPGWKYNMTDLQAALGLHQLERLEDNLRRRQEIWARYDEAFGAHPLLTIPPPFDKGRHARHLYTLLLDIDRAPCDRNGLLERLRALNIGAGIHFLPVHLYTFYRERFGTKRGDFPNAEWIGDRTFSLPLSSKLTDEDVEDVIWAVNVALEA